MCAAAVGRQDCDRLVHGGGSRRGRYASVYDKGASIYGGDGAVYCDSAADYGDKLTFAVILLPFMVTVLPFMAPKLIIMVGGAEDLEGGRKQRTVSIPLPTGQVRDLTSLCRCHAMSSTDVEYGSTVVRCRGRRCRDWYWRRVRRY